MNAATDAIWIGTSGWSYDHWDGVLFEAGTPADEQLAAYADSFDTVEVDNTFYQLPDEGTLEAWEETAPDGFQFAIQASRYITHMKKLKDVDESVGELLDRVELLGDKLGPILFQCPPNWNRDAERLAAFLDVLPRGHEYAFEFRDPSWFHDEIYELLRANDAACCIYDMEGETAPLEIITDLIYVRLHKPEGDDNWDYSPQALTAWADRFVEWAGDGHEVFCYFNNDRDGAAVRNADLMYELLEHRS